MRVFAVAKVFVVNERGEFLALRRDPHDFNRPGQWDFPGGQVEIGEELLAAARRETGEETGFSPKNLQLVYGVSGVNQKGNVIWLFFTEHVQGRPEVRLSHEHVESAWLTPKEF